MGISPIGNNYAFDFPDYPDINAEPIDTIKEVQDTFADQNNVRDVGSAAIISASAVAQDEIKAYEVQENFLRNVEELKNGDLSSEEFSNYLKDNGINSIDFQEKNLSNENLVSALFTITNQNNLKDENNLSQYANMMDKINEETQSASINEKLSAYTENLRY